MPEKIQIKKFEIIYNLLIILLSIIVICIIIIQTISDLSSEEAMLLNNIDKAIWIIFIADYILRLLISSDKKNFILVNIIDLIAILPFDSIFKALRITRIMRLMKLLRAIRIFILLFKIHNQFSKFVKTNSFHNVLKMTILTVFLGALGFYFTEGRSFADSLWWSFVTATTVGYGDISPTTIPGRATASILMITGIGFIGMLTSTISAYFINKKNEERGQSYKSEIIDSIKAKLDDFENISDKDIDDICSVLKALRNE